MGSASELDYHLLLSHDLEFRKEDDFKRTNSNLVEVRKMLTAFLNTVEEQIEAKARAVAKA